MSEGPYEASADGRRISRARQRISHAEHYAQRGRLAAAERMLRDAGGVLERRQQFAGAARAAALLGTLLRERGDIDRAGPVVEHARRLLQETVEQRLRDAEREDCLKARALLANALPTNEPEEPARPDGVEEQLTAHYVACIRATAAVSGQERLDRVCQWLRGRLGAQFVAVYGVGDNVTRLATAGEPDPRSTQLIRLALEEGPGCSTSRRRGQYAVVPIGSQAPIGAIAASWSGEPRPDHPPALGLMQVAAALCEEDLAERVESQQHRSSSGGRGGLVGQSAEMSAVLDYIDHAAAADYPVLIEGETGVGKELVARAVHQFGTRRGGSFCAVNCAALSDELFEAELFGHARGAFTGAIRERTGLIESAHRGTLFLDEVGELSVRAQAKLLRVIQEGEVRRIGENVPRGVDVRLVAATNRHLASEVRAGRFRQDLLFRLAVVCVKVPPLRARVGDVELLARELWARAMTRASKRATLTPDVLEALAGYHWPGNVRELQNIIARLAVFAPRRGRVDVTALPPELRDRAAQRPASLADARLRFERRFVKAALRRTAGRPTAAARELGISRQGLAKLLKRVGDVPDPSG